MLDLMELCVVCPRHITLSKQNATNNTSDIKYCVTALFLFSTEVLEMKNKSVA